MRSIATDVAHSVRDKCVCLWVSVGHIGKLRKTAKTIEMRFGSKVMYAKGPLYPLEDISTCPSEVTTQWRYTNVLVFISPHGMAMS